MRKIKEKFAVVSYKEVIEVEISKWRDLQLRWQKQVFMIFF